jgi:aquaporin Z
MRTALREHWPEYLIEAVCLGVFMVSASVFGVWLFHPSSPATHVFAGHPVLQRAVMGLAMGGTAIGLIFSPWGQRSGAHLNPAVTLTFFRLGKVAPWDATFYVVAQFLGGIAGMILAAAILRTSLADPAVNYVVTLPGPRGAGLAFLAEAVITFILMIGILKISNTAAIARYTGLFAGALVALYITFEAPLSGMSLNPARTFGSALIGHIWNSLWIYFVAPLFGMLLAAEVYRRRAGLQRVYCAKLHHHNRQRCIFRCDFASLEKPTNPNSQPLEVVT